MKIFVTAITTLIASFMFVFTASADLDDGPTAYNRVRSRSEIQEFHTLNYSGNNKEDTLCVSTAGELQSALTSAAANGQDDEIHIVRGTYTGNFVYESSDELYDLTIKGGYAADCASRVEDPSVTVLDGNRNGTVLLVDCYKNFDFVLEGVTIQNGSSSSKGGGLHLNTWGNNTLKNNIIKDNNSSSIGGGIHFSGPNRVVLLNNDIINNNALERDGGGIYICTSYTILDIISNIIRDNKANVIGGGASVCAGRVTLVNNIICDNSAAWGGGGISLYDCDKVVLTNNTITGNADNHEGGGVLLRIFKDSGIADIYNNIIWNNIAAKGGDLSIINGNASVNLFNNDFDQSGDGLYIENSFSIDPGNLNNKTPKFTNPDNHDYHLNADSPCVNAGINAASKLPDTDKDGNPRILNNIADIGAYEYTGPVSSDTTPPSDCSVIINKGDETTGSSGVTLTLFASDDSGMGQIQVSNDKINWSQSMDYATSVSWSLLAGQGEKRVYVRFSDAVGNWTNTEIFDDIFLAESVPGPADLTVEEVKDEQIVLKWQEIIDPPGIMFNVYRSETKDGIYYQVNTSNIDHSHASHGWLYFTDRDLKNTTTYYYKVKSFLGKTESNYSGFVTAKTTTSYNYDLNIIDPATIRNISGTAKYYIQIFPTGDFSGNLLVNCLELTEGLTHKFYLNGQETGTNVSDLALPASVKLELTLGSATPVGEHSFTLKVTDTITGESHDYPLLLTVVPGSGYGIHAEIEKELVCKSDQVRIYGSIFPAIPGRQVELVITMPDNPLFSITRTVSTDTYGKFEDDEWISTLGIGTYQVKASWTDDNTDTHFSEAREFTVEKGRTYISCARESGVTPETGKDLTISGSLSPGLTSPFITLRITDPDGKSEDAEVYQDAGGYAITRSFFNKSGIWKFKAYWLGNQDYIGCESDFLIVPVDVDFGRAIILGGGEADQTNTYWNVTRKLVVEAYRNFKAKGFADDMIWFMINSEVIDIDFDDKADPVVDDSIPTVSDFIGALTSRFSSNLKIGTPLFVYMQGHGSRDGRFKVLGTDEFVSASEIGNALDMLQIATGCQVILILESCFSGNFIKDLSGNNRVILTSAGDEQYNTDASGRISFSRYVFSKLTEGDNLKKAFEYARKSLVNMGYPSPRLDDNGDGKADNDDGLLASNIYFNGLLTWGLRPEIREISVEQVLESSSSTPISLSVVKGDADIEKVRAQVISPNANITGGETTISYPEVNLVYNSYTGQYEGNLSGLGRPGIYKIVVQAEDNEHEVSDPGIVYISAAGTLQFGDVNGDGDVNISDAVLALKIICGIDENIAVHADVNEDGKIGADEVVYILQEIAGLR